MKIEQKDLLNKYAELKLKAKALEQELEELNPQVLSIMQETAVEEIEVGDLGKLTMASRRTWVYPEFIQEKEKELKKEKKEAEQTGTADYSEKHYVMFKEAKVEE